MKSNTQTEVALPLGAFLRDRRARLSPACGSNDRRRTPGLRREEVAARAHVSVTWYTFLEQGRGGPPSSAVLERLARALELDRADREILFVLAQNRPAPIEPSQRAIVPPTLRRVIDAMPATPAYVRTITWDVVAWNAATSAVLSDYSLLPVKERNVLRRLFAPGVDHRIYPHWEAFAGFALAAFRVDLARSPDCSEAVALATELQATSSDFRRLWAENKVLSHWVGRKQFDHPILGPLTLDYSSFSVDGTSGLSLVVFTPSTDEQSAAIARLVHSRLSISQSERPSMTSISSP